MWMRQSPGVTALSCCFLLFIVLSAFMTPRPALADGHPRNVQVLLSSQPELPANQAIVKGLESVLKVDPDIHVFYEFLDAMRFPGEEHLRQSDLYLRAKYAASHFDIAITIGPEALYFLLNRDTRLISPANIVFGGISEDRSLLLAQSNNNGGATFSFDLPLPVEVSDGWAESYSVSG